MDIFSIMAISPLEGRYFAKLSDLRSIFSEFSLIKMRVTVEVRWLQFLANEAKLPELPPFSLQQNQFLTAIIETFSTQDALKIKQIEQTTNHDVKAVEYFIKEKLAGYAGFEKINEFIHFGCTSEDINNLAYGLMLLKAKEHCLLPMLNKLSCVLCDLAKKYAAIPMLARTHGQAATPTTLGKEIANVAARLTRQITAFSETAILGKLNGASGNYNAFVAAYPDFDWQNLSQQFVTRLGLNWNAYTTQIEPHDYMAELFNAMTRINVILIDLTRDMWGYIALNYFTQRSVEHEVGSSTMPHKINPIDFENAEGNLGIANALFEHMALKLPISRWQRDLSDSTVLRNIGVAFAHTLLAYQALLKGLNKIIPNDEVIAADLDQHWEILAEPIQTLMRKYGLSEPYEQLKAFTRGKVITKTLLHEFITKLALPDLVKQQLLALTPSQYVGMAPQLAKDIEVAK